MSKPSSPDDTQKSLRSLGGLICPECRYRKTEELGAELKRCPYDDRVLIEPVALAEADGDPILGSVVGGRFAVLELLGAGSMGTVYRARQEAMGRDVALKVVRSDRLVDAQASQRFQQEARAMSMLASRYTVTVFDFGEIRIDGDDPHLIDGSLYLAMELIEGESLGERLKRDHRLGVPEALKIMKHALESLQEAHEKGVIHRDLKPDNLILTLDPSTGDHVCKVLDFGIAKVLTHQGGVDALETQAGTVFGTPRYMSPEQAQGKPLDARSDLYSLGVILYHMLLGQPPYMDGDAVVVMAHHIKTPPKPPSEVAPELELPGELEQMLSRVLSKNAEERPQSAVDFINEIKMIGDFGESSVVSSSMTAVVEQRSPSGGSLKMVAVAALALLGVVMLAVRAVSDDRPVTAISVVRVVTQGLDGSLAELVSADVKVQEPSPDDTSVVVPPTSAEAVEDSRTKVPGPLPSLPKGRTYERFDRP